MFFYNLANPDFNKYYNLTKKMPLIMSIVVLALVFIWSIVDVSVFSHDWWDGCEYGIMRLESLALVLIIWWAIGVVLAIGTWFFTTLALAPKVEQIETLKSIKSKLNKLQ